MTRWLLALGATVVVVAAGYLAFLNPDPVVVHLTPTRTATAPLAVALLLAAATGGVLVGLVAGFRAGARGWRRWRATRRTQREAKHAARIARARDLLWAGDHAQARAELARHEGDAPNDPAHLALLAEAHLQAGDPAAARALLEPGLGRLGPDARLLDLLADAAERVGDLSTAADALVRARELLPHSPRLTRRLRDVYAAAGRWRDAVALQSDLLLQLHDPATLAAERVRLCGLRFEAACAEPEARAAARLLAGLAREYPDFVPAWVAAGDRLLAAGRTFLARRAWERGARHHPVTILLDRLAGLYADHPERIIRLLRRLRRRHPNAPGVAFELVRHLIAHGELDQAASELGALPATLAGHPRVHALWGDLHRQRGNHTLAAEAFARAADPAGGLAAPFSCSACHTPAPAWAAACPACHRWGTVAGAADEAVTLPG